jgi:hypothetical protein
MHDIPPYLKWRYRIPSSWKILRRTIGRCVVHGILSKVYYTGLFAIGTKDLLAVSNGTFLHRPILATSMKRLEYYSGSYAILLYFGITDDDCQLTMIWCKNKWESSHSLLILTHWNTGKTAWRYLFRRYVKSSSNFPSSAQHENNGIARMAIFTPSDAGGHWRFIQQRQIFPSHSQKYSPMLSPPPQKAPNSKTMTTLQSSFLSPPLQR